jgi:hypothetical protein
VLVCSVKALRGGMLDGKGLRHMSGALCGYGVVQASSWRNPGVALASSWRNPGVALASSWRSPGVVLASSRRSPGVGHKKTPTGISRGGGMVLNCGAV